MLHFSMTLRCLHSITPVLFLVLSVLMLAACKDSPTRIEDLPELPQPRFVDPADYTVTGSGLMYYDFYAGDTNAARADSGEVVLVHYHGWLEDGTLFESSIIDQRPLQLLLGFGRNIKGFDEGISGMYLGGERQLVIPPELGYGELGRGIVPPNATLIFEVILIGAQ